MKLMLVLVLCMAMSFLEAVPMKNGYQAMLKKLRLSDSSLQSRTSNAAQAVTVVSSVCLGAHNAKRALHQDDPNLAWNTGLASASSTYAVYLAGNDLFQHSDTQGGGYGENLYYFSKYTWGSSSSSSSGEDPCEKAVQSWYDEISQYDFNNHGFSSATGHFTQVVWKSTTDVGVGVARRQYEEDGWTVTKTYVVARYTPAGNVMSQFADNVPTLISS